jgi:hypothetical protein
MWSVTGFFFVQKKEITMKKEEYVETLVKNWPFPFVKRSDTSPFTSDAVSHRVQSQIMKQEVTKCQAEQRWGGI